MTTTHDARHRIYYEHVRQILLERWEPIAVTRDPGVQDEYDSYTYPIVDLLIRGGSRDSLVACLDDIARDRLGATPDARHTQVVADLLMQFRGAAEAV